MWASQKEEKPCIDTEKGSRAKVCSGRSHGALMADWECIQYRGDGLSVKKSCMETWEPVGGHWSIKSKCFQEPGRQLNEAGQIEHNRE